jgi:hypothetical protein
MIHDYTHVKISQLVNKMCSQQACSKLVNKVVTMLLFHQVATRLSLTTCWQIVELQDDNKLLEQLVTSLFIELNNLVASCQQAVDNLSTSWEQTVRTHPVDKLLEQHCYKSAAGLLQLVRFYVCSWTGEMTLRNVAVECMCLHVQWTICIIDYILI